MKVEEVICADADGVLSQRDRDVKTIPSRVISGDRCSINYPVSGPAGAAGGRSRLLPRSAPRLLITPLRGLLVIR